MSSPSRSSPPSDVPGIENSTSEIKRLKRCLAALQQEVNDANGVHAKKSPTTVTMGRGIRRLVALFEPIDTIIAEADFRIQLENDGSQLPEPSTPDEIEARLATDRTYRGYTLLLRLIPHLKSLIENLETSNEDLYKFVALLQKGANDARSDDVQRIKEELDGWLNTDFSPSAPFSIKSRSDHGLRNNVTGRLLFPLEHDWDDERTRLAIQAGEIDISDDLFLTCLYPKGKGNPNDVEANFLRGGLLVKTFCAIFTSPTSSESFDAESESDEGPLRQKQKTCGQKKATKSNVATLLHMEGKVTARSIAYAATILAFNLTDASQWTEIYNGFSFSALYNFIVNYFEDTPNEAAKERASILLKWWNRHIFPHQAATTSNASKSRNKLAAQRSANINARAPVV